MNSENLELFGPYVASLVALIAAALLHLRGLQKNRFERDVQSNEIEQNSLAEANNAWRELVEPYRERVSVLEESVVLLQTEMLGMREEMGKLRRHNELLTVENEVLHRGSERLELQLRASEIVPVWTHVSARGDNDK